MPARRGVLVFFAFSKTVILHISVFGIGPAIYSLPILLYDDYDYNDEGRIQMSFKIKYVTTVYER